MNSMNIIKAVVFAFFAVLVASGNVNELILMIPSMMMRHYWSLVVLSLSPSALFQKTLYFC